MSPSPSLENLRECFEGAVPAVIATCDLAGVPNVTYVSQVHFVDAEHLALSFQFFNKTRENLLANPQVTLLMFDPVTAARYRLALLYLRTESEGPLFESMKAKLAGIASQTGMSGVFRLLGADIYRVLEIEQVPGPELPAPLPAIPRLAALRRLSQTIAGSTDLASLLDRTLAGLETHLDIRHAMILMLDEPASKLFTVASRGYPESGVGSEIALGEGVIGVAAQHATPIRITYLAPEYSYSRAIREHALQDGLGDLLEQEIPFVGLRDPHSQLAVPIIAAGRTLGVLYVESLEQRRFRYDDEDALVTVAAQLGLATLSLQQAAECPTADAGQAQEGSSLEPSAAGVPVAGVPAAGAPAAGAPVAIRHYAANDSVFIGEDYLIKGVAGAIFWRLVTSYVNERRTDFSNRELRLDPSLRLPEIDDNLEARLILLQRRLEERGGDLCIQKTGRGRFRLVVHRTIRLVDMSAEGMSGQA